MDGLGANLVANLMWFLLGTAATFTRNCIKLRGQRQFWGPFLKGRGWVPVVTGRGPISVVLTDKEGNTPKSPPKISLTDVHAYSDVRSVLESLGLTVEIKARTQADMAQLRTECFVSLGGPVYNGITDMVLRRLGSRLPVFFNDTQKCFTYGGASYKSELDEGGQVKRDYGLIIRLQKLDSNDLTSKPVLVAFGLHGHGTQQAVHAIVANADLALKMKPYLSGNAFAFLEFMFHDHKCTGSKVLVVDKIN